MRWICPLCTQVLTQSAKHWQCDQGHLFDVAKNGYINLHTVQQKGSKQPGDNKDMINARHRFLAAGYYQPLVEALGSFVFTHLSDDPAPLEWLDVGCGDGHYLRALQERLPQTQWCGIDISKEAIKVAARAKRQAPTDKKHTSGALYTQQNPPPKNTPSSPQFVVASSRHIPIGDAACDGILQIFAPTFAPEIQRILKPEGKLIRVTPGPHHLRELREALYLKTHSHQPSDTPQGFTKMGEQRVTTQININEPDHRQDLIAMTPYQWHGKQSVKDQFTKDASAQITLDFEISCFRVATPAEPAAASVTEPPTAKASGENTGQPSAILL